MGDYADVFFSSLNPRVTCATFVVKMRPPKQSLANNSHLQSEHFRTFVCLLSFDIDEQDQY